MRLSFSVHYKFKRAEVNGCVNQQGYELCEMFKKPAKSKSTDMSSHFP